MTELYEFVVLRLTLDPMRGETINVGLVIFNPDGHISIRIRGALNKIRSLDTDWGKSQIRELEEHVLSVAATLATTEERIEALATLGLCRPGQPGFFFANKTEVAREIRDLESMYVVPAGSNQRLPANALLKELMAKLRGMSLLGTSIDDLEHHLAVPHVPIPDNPDLKGDLVYKNGVYRVTQTVDYRVAPKFAHRKIQEVCVKVMATTQAAKHWGADLKKFAVIQVPDAIADIADSHIDLLLADGYNIFHFDRRDDLARYHTAVFGH